MENINIIDKIISLIPKDSVEYEFIIPDLNLIKQNNEKITKDTYQIIVDTLGFHLGAANTSWKKEIILVIRGYNFYVK